MTANNPTLADKVRGLADALRPFAALFDPGAIDGDEWDVMVSNGDVRRARAALARVESIAAEAERAPVTGEVRGMAEAGEALREALEEAMGYAAEWAQEKYGDEWMRALQGWLALPDVRALLAAPVAPLLSMCATCGEVSRDAPTGWTCPRCPVAPVTEGEADACADVALDLANALDAVQAWVPDDVLDRHDVPGLIERARRRARFDATRTGGGR